MHAPFRSSGVAGHTRLYLKIRAYDVRADVTSNSTQTQGHSRVTQLRQQKYHRVSHRLVLSITSSLRIPVRSFLYGNQSKKIKLNGYTSDTMETHGSTL